MASTADEPEQTSVRARETPSAAPSITPSALVTKDPGVFAGQTKRSGGGRSRSDNPHVQRRP